MDRTVTAVADRQGPARIRMIFSFSTSLPYPEEMRRRVRERRPVER